MHNFIDSIAFTNYSKSKEGTGCDRKDKITRLITRDKAFHFRSKAEKKCNHCTTDCRKIFLCGYIFQVIFLWSFCIPELLADCDR